MVRAFSFCLYGPNNPIYYIGLVQNIELITKYFPSWKAFVYVAPDVEQTMITKLESYSNVILRFTGVTGAINMVHRFYAIDEPDVELMMVRDADSRIHWKDRWAISEFIRHPQFVAHTIRDNPAHTTQIMGGLWGLRKSSGLNMHHEYKSYEDKKHSDARHGHDQDFLADIIYPKVVQNLLVHYSCGCALVGEIAVEFPFTYTNDIYCGRVEQSDCEDYPGPPNPPNIQIPPRITAPEPPRVPPVPSNQPPSKLLSFLRRK